VRKAGETRVWGDEQTQQISQPQAEQVIVSIPKQLSLAPLIALVATLAFAAASASAATPSAAWSIRSVAQPTNFASGDGSGDDTYKILVTNVGSLPSNGEPVTIADTLPAGKVTPVKVEGFNWEYASHIGAGGELSCTTTPVQCTWNGVVPAGDVLEMNVPVATEATASGSLTNTVSVNGGGAAEASSSAENAVSTTAAPAGISDFSFDVDGVDGAPDAQAGGHPYAVTTTLDLPTHEDNQNGEFEYEAAESIKDTVVELPLGLVGDPQAAPRCPLTGLALEPPQAGEPTRVQCPADTKIGDVALSEPTGFASSLFPPLIGSGVLISSVSAVYNLVPEHGHPAEFGFDYAGLVEALIYPSVVRTSSGYVLRVTTPDTPAVFFPGPGFVSGFSLTLFGDPAKHGTGGEAPFFTNSSDCAASESERTATIHIDTWTHQATMTNADGTPDFNDPNWQTAMSSLPPVTGCNALSFKPTIEAKPESTRSDSPTGLTFDLKVPQAPSSDAALATPDLEDATVTLPAGMTLSPSASNGLQACSPAQIGLEDNSQPTCPEASKIGTVTLTTPLLANPIGGSVYLAEQTNNPFGSLIALYVVVNDPATGTLVKLAGHGELGDGSNGLAPGQLRTTFANNPQLPFSELKLQLKEGPRAPLTTPATCGTYTTESLLTPWSTLPGGNPSSESGPTATPSSSFQITSGPNGEACASQGFAPSFTAGTQSNQAAGFSPFTLTLSRSDSEQGLGGLTVTTPPGLLGMLSRVQLCQEPQAEEGKCPSASQIGHVVVGAGPGPDPVYVPQAGKAEDPVFLTGPYKGAPFGLSVVVPAEAGPFNLGTVVVRSAITVNPSTGQVTITSDPFPTILQGVPLQVKTVNVTVDRAGFIFNPTSCDPSSVTGTVVSTQGARAAVSSPFQTAGCAGLPFTPVFSASTQAHTSRLDGASLDVKVGYPPEPYANIHKVDVSLPLVLPARLTTLNKACTETQFAVNPAGCPEGSFVGMATAHTPVLSSPLVGPAILVSHGGEAFPDLDVVLQGEGVEIILTGNTDIKKGITYSKFETVPDAPVSSFELNLPEGPHSILTATGSLCAQSLAMPTTIVGQNGAQIKQSTKIAMSGCKVVTIGKRKLSGGSVVLSVNLTTKGVVTITGKGLKRYHKTLGAGSHQIKVGLSNAGLSARRRHRNITIKVTLKSGSKASSANTSLKL
jgi:hypothetical protein